MNNRIRACRHADHRRLSSQALFVALPLLLATLGGCSRAPSDAAGQRTAVVTRGPIDVLTPCAGIIETRKTETLFSRFQGRATVVEIIPDGAEVRPGDTLMRFDSSDIENDLVKLNNDLARSRAELDALENADIPIERADIKARLGELRAAAESEQQALQDTRELVDRQLLSRRELEQQESRAAVALAKAGQLEAQLKLTVEHLHPARLARARSACDAAARQVEVAARQLSNAVIRAPSAGLVVHLPVPIGAEYRTIRVGDSVYPGQPLMCIPDLKEFVVQSFIPESQLARVAPGTTATVTPAAYPDCRLPAAVETVGATAQTRPGYPSWQKYFRITARITQADPRLRPGMSAAIEIRSYSRPDAVLLPRNAVVWKDGFPFCHKRTPRGAVLQPVVLGPGNDEVFEVIRGVEAGDAIVLQ